MSDFKLPSLNNNSLEDIGRQIESTALVEKIFSPKIDDTKKTESESIRWEDTEQQIDDDYLEEIDILSADNIYEEIFGNEDKKKEVINSIITAVWVSNNPEYDDNDKDSYLSRNKESSNESYPFLQELIYLVLGVVIVLVVIFNIFFDYDERNEIKGKMPFLTDVKEYSYAVEERVREYKNNYIDEEIEKFKNNYIYKEEKKYKNNKEKKNKTDYIGNEVENHKNNYTDNDKKLKAM